MDLMEKKFKLLVTITDKNLQTTTTKKDLFVDTVYSSLLRAATANFLTSDTAWSMIDCI